MANPALIAKAAAIVLSEDRLRKSIGWMMVAALAPFIVTVAVLCGILSGAANHNNSVLDLCFHGGVIAGRVPEAYRAHIESMRDSFLLLDATIDEQNANMESGTHLDTIQIKAVFYALYFGGDLPSATESRQFVECFIACEDRTRTVLNEKGKPVSIAYDAFVPIKDLSKIYESIGRTMGKPATNEDMVNAQEIYYRIAYGKPAPLEDDSAEDWEGWSCQLSSEEREALYHKLPPGTMGNKIVDLALNRLGDPYSQTQRGRGSYVDCSYLTLWCYKQLGLQIPGTAAEQGRFCVNNGLTIAKKDLTPGDLVFWSHKPNGRFMNITHVGIYAGNGKVIDASCSRGKVVYRSLFDTDKQVLYGRPHIQK